MINYITNKWYLVDTKVEFFIFYKTLNLREAIRHYLVYVCFIYLCITDRLQVLQEDHFIMTISSE